MSILTFIDIKTIFARDQKSFNKKSENDVVEKLYNIGTLC
jgi:hypothetical protein